MSKKITVNFKDEFSPGEFAVLSALTIKTLHSKFPGFIVHVNTVKLCPDGLGMVHVYGMGDSNEGEVIAQSVVQCVEEMVLSLGRSEQSSPEQEESETEALPADLATFPKVEEKAP